jgi:hypothetical protein
MSSVACTASREVTFINPSDQPLYVQINQRDPFEVAARGSVRANVPSLERLKPILITARDADGRIVFAYTSSVARIEATPVVELNIDSLHGQPFAYPTYPLPGDSP